MMKKLLMIIFTENSSLGVSMLSHVAAEKGWDVEILFIPPSHNDDEQVHAFIDDFNPDVIGISFKSFERKQALSTAAKIRPWTNAKMIAGGIHPTLMPDEILETGIFDGVVTGDGLGIFADLLDGYKNLNGTVIKGMRHPDINAYNRYFHSRSQIERMKNTRTATVLTGIGCPYKCTFCHSGSNNYFAYPIESVAGYVSDLMNRYGVTNFHFLDDLFASNVKRLAQFRKHLEEKAPGFTFSSQVSARANTFTKAIAEELKKLGIETVNFGIETASTKLLNFLNKQQTSEDCYRAVEICRESGLNCVINLMFGMPAQDEDDYIKTLEYVRRAQPDSVNCFYYTPYPGTALYKYCFENGYLPDSADPERFDWFEPVADGISDIQIRLNKIDYEMAARYAGEINQAVNRDHVLKEKMDIIDQRPWVLVGTNRHFYFKRMIRKLSSLPRKDCLGYIDIDGQAGFQLDNDDDLIPAFKGEGTDRPFWCITYSFRGADFKVIERYAAERFGTDVPVLSLSSFQKSHSAAEIKTILNQ
jgi:anaerobic magnesium-protoporphyrin IX monomethyl ester cyclase